jgi:hypothetical protein
LLSNLKATKINAERFLLGLRYAASGEVPLVVPPFARGTIFCDS